MSSISERIAHDPDISGRGPPKRILVVDDEPSVAITICLVLKLQGHETETAEDAEQALKKFAAGKYDLVITDYNLPGMTGLELARILKIRPETTPIILVSAHAHASAWDQESLANIDGMVAKPFTLQELQEALDKAFSTPPGPSNAS